MPERLYRSAASCGVVFFLVLFAAACGAGPMARSWSQRARLVRHAHAVEFGYVSARPSGMSFVGVPTPLSNNVRRVARGMDAHLSLNVLIGADQYHARHAANAARLALSDRMYARVQQILRDANRATHVHRIAARPASADMGAAVTLTTGLAIVSGRFAWAQLDDHDVYPPIPLRSFPGAPDGDDSFGMLDAPLTKTEVSLPHVSFGEGPEVRVFQTHSEEGLVPDPVFKQDVTVAVVDIIASLIAGVVCKVSETSLARRSKRSVASALAEKMGSLAAGLRARCETLEARLRDVQCAARDDEETLDNYIHPWNHVSNRAYAAHHRCDDIEEKLADLVAAASPLPAPPTPAGRDIRPDSVVASDGDDSYPDDVLASDFGSDGASIGAPRAMRTRPLQP